MRVLLVHNRYRTSAPSGEDFAVRNEHSMLERRGVEVIAHDRCNDDINDRTIVARASTMANTIWSQRSRGELGRVIRRVKPNIVHVHNTFAMLSPSIYGVCQREGVPVVQTLHNFRFFCPAALFLRNGKPCEECVDIGLHRSVVHRCYRNSVGASATLATMLAVNRSLGTYAHGIDRYITLTEFGRKKALQSGIPAHKLRVKPNFVPEPPQPGQGGGGYVVYVGRLLEGKGADIAVQAWQQLRDVKLLVVGDGAQRQQLESLARSERLNVEFVGVQQKNYVMNAIAHAEFLLMPSVCYETFGLAIAEAFACGTPVLASRIGSLDELVEEGITGMKFNAGDPHDLARGVRTMLSDPARLARMRTAARDYFDARLTESQNFDRLMQIYGEVVTDKTAVPTACLTERRA